ncbi:MAG: DUF2079 domain-containing protein [bacterium]
MKKFFQNRENLIVVIILTIFSLVYIIVPYLKHWNLDTALFDFGLQEQVVWNTIHGRWFASSPEVTNFLGDHFSPILLLVAGIYKIFPFSFTLFVIQTLGVTAGIIALYKIAKIHIKSASLRILFLVILVLYRPLAGLLLFEFHEIALAFPLLAWGIYFLEKKKLGVSLIFLTLAMFCKEDVGIFVTMLGLYFVIFRKEKKALILVFYGVIYALAALFVFLPYFRSGEGSDTLQRYSYLGNGPKEIIKNFFTKPYQMLRLIIHWDKVNYIRMLFTPMLLVILVLPELFILVTPAFLVNFMSNSVHMVGTAKQYDVITSVAIFYAFIMGLAKFEKNQFYGKYQLNINIKKGLIFLLIAFNLVALHNHNLIVTIQHLENRGADRVAVQKLLKEIPQNAVLYVSNSLGGQTARFQNLYLFDPAWLPQKVQPEYILIDQKKYSGYYDFAQSTEYQVLDQKGNIVLYRNEK